MLINGKVDGKRVQETFILAAYACNTLPSNGFAGPIFSLKVGGTINVIDCSYRKSDGLKDN